MSNTIQADPAKLRRVGEDIGKIQSSLRVALSSSNSQVTSLKGVWTGAAAETFQSNFQKLYSQCQEGLDVMERMVRALYESADTYERTEKSVQQEASKLPKLPMR